MKTEQRRALTPNEVYAWTPIETSKNISVLEHHFQDEIPWFKMNYDKNEKIELKYYAKQYTDNEKYTWELFSIWYDGKPIAICEAGGRYGESHNLNFPTDKEGYKNFLSYLLDLCDEEEEEGVYDPSQPIRQLGLFENQDIHWFYNHELNPKYKEGDIVDAQVVLEKRNGYIPYDAKYIPRKVKITKVNKFNPHWTYYGYEVERHQTGKYDHSTKEDTRQIVEISSEEQLRGNKMYLKLNVDLEQVD